MVLGFKNLFRVLFLNSDVTYNNTDRHLCNVYVIVDRL